MSWTLGLRIQGLWEGKKETRGRWTGVWVGLNKPGSRRFKGAAKNLWKRVWTEAIANSLAS